ncbi:MAG: FliO/MopB family protein [Rhodospirillales bacterium]|nr:FliO/MopB family protein [Rhodospirillales bacterium]
MDGLDFNLTDYMKFVLAFIFVMALIGLATVAARRFGFGLPSASRNPAQRRLGIVESLNVDGKRRLVLIRRDDCEHLLLLGTASELLIEGAITPPQNAFSKALNEAHKATHAPATSPGPQGPPLPKALIPEDPATENKP